MKDNEIIKALECYTSTEGHILQRCPLDDIQKVGCCMRLAEYALDLINRQKAEIERLEEEVDIVSSSKRTILDRIPSERAEAIKEFKEKYKEHIKNFTGMFTDEMGFMVNLDAILFAVDFVADNLAKETTEEERL